MLKVEVRRASELEVDDILLCLAAAFEPYRNQYTPEGYADTIVGSKNIRQRMAEMHVLVACEGAQDSSCIIGTIAYQFAGTSSYIPSSSTSIPSAHLPFTIYHLPGCEGHIRGMAVLPSHLGCGVASQLLTAAEQGLKEQGATYVTLDTTEPLKRAQRFYEKNGYQPTGRESDFYGMRLIELGKSL